jgi:hypothetical protein
MPTYTLMTIGAVGAILFYLGRLVSKTFKPIEKSFPPPAFITFRGILAYLGLIISCSGLALVLSCTLIFIRGCQGG